MVFIQYYFLRSQIPGFAKLMKIMKYLSEKIYQEIHIILWKNDECVNGRILIGDIFLDS